MSANWSGPASAPIDQGNAFRSSEVKKGKAKKIRKNAVCQPRARVAKPTLKCGEPCHSDWTSQLKTSAMSAIQLVRAMTARPSNKMQSTQVVMKYGVGFVAGNFVIAIMIRTNGSEAASAGMLRRTCAESAKIC